MAEFKPMVKMMTDEPSVILKLKKGGHVHSKSKKEEHGHKSMSAVHKMDGGTMRALAAAPVGNPIAARAMAAKRKPMLNTLPRTPMKKGGHAESAKEHKAEMHELHKVEKELKHHEKMTASKAHHGLKTGGKVHKASGGAIDKDETRTTLKPSVAKFAKTKVDEAHRDKAHGTGAIREGKPAGYKRGGKVEEHCYGGPIKKAIGGTIEGNEGKFAKTKVDEAHRDTAHGTKGIREANAGGFKSGGGVNWENRPANSARPGVTGGTTGAVREANAGGYKSGGAAKKRYATGGTVDSGRAVAMPQGKKKPSAPVAISELAGTFKKGGRVC